MLNDEIRQQKDKFRQMDMKQKLQYIWDYYKWPILITLFVIILLSSFIHDRVTAKKDVLYVVMLDSAAQTAGDSDMLDDFSGTLSDFDPDKEELFLDATINTEGNGSIGYTYMQKVLAQYNIGSIDVTIAPRETIEKFAEFQAFGDLRDLLPKDLYDEILSSGREILYTDYEDPATGEIKHDIPIAVNISDSEPILKGFTDIEGNRQDYFESDCYIAISPNTSYLEHSIAFLRYMLEKGE